MQIVINIHEKDYQSILNGHIPFAILDVMKKGTVLSEHGDLVDRNEIEVEEDVYNQTYIIHAPTILEATGVEE